MPYYIEQARNFNFEDTAIPNLFISDFMPDVPDGDFIKAYIYAYMCCRQGTSLTHTELADRLGIMPEKVIAAWRYFSERGIVKLVPQTPGDELHFDVVFIDIKGVLYGSNGRSASEETGVMNGLEDPALAELFRRLAVICGIPGFDGSDMQRIVSWIADFGATAEIIEYAWRYCAEERGEKSANYVGKVVRDWSEKGFKTAAEVREHRANTDARSGVHRQLMEAVGMKYAAITSFEEKLFNYWLDDLGYTADEILELAQKTAGIRNKLKYLEGIIRNETNSKGAGTGGGPAAGRTGKTDRNEHYRQIRRKNEEAAALHLEEVYAALPEVKKADNEKLQLNTEISKTLASGMPDRESAVARLIKETEAVSARRRELLEQAGYPADYTEVHFNCQHCRDTGLLENGTSCDCFSNM